VKEDGAVKRQSFKTAVVLGIFLSWKRTKGKEILVLLTPSLVGHAGLVIPLVTLVTNASLRFFSYDETLCGTTIFPHLLRPWRAHQRPFCGGE
jgi:hypothetical protein